MSKEEKKKKDKIKIKPNKHRRYSFINAIDEHITKYLDVYHKIIDSKDSLTEDLFLSMNKLLVEDYYASINNLTYLAKQGMKVLKKKESYENRRIFWYLVRRFFRFKKNEEIEKLIQKKEQYGLELGYLFEDIISAKIREKIEKSEEDFSEDIEEEPNYVTKADELFEGPSEERALFPEVVSKGLDNNLGPTGQLEYND